MGYKRVLKQYVINDYCIGCYNDLINRLLLTSLFKEIWSIK